MNKRIKNKVTKRIINKMQSKKGLTEFEKKFFDKHLCYSFSNIATEFLDSFISVMTRWLEYEKGKVEEQIAEMESSEADSPSIVVMDQGNNAYIKKESKWQIAKGKVKGWFGK